MLKIVTSFLGLLIALNLNAMSLKDLFQSLKNQPISKKDEMSLKIAQLSKKQAQDRLFPKMYGIISYDHFNRPSSMRPVLPTETPERLAHGDPLPFSKNIMQFGLSFDFPVFVKALYTIKDKANMLKLAKKETIKINLIQREATILGADANLKYLEKLSLALQAKRKSLMKMREDIVLKVKNGRLPQIALVKIDENLNNIDIAQNKININKNALENVIYTLSGIEIKKSINFEQQKKINKDKFFALLPLRDVLKAKKLGLQASQESLYPSLFLKANYAQSYADGYNNNKSLHTDFGSIGLFLSIPIFDKTKYTNIQKSRVAYESEMLNIADVKHSLKSKVMKIEKDLKILKVSKRLAKKSVKLNKTLLKVSQVAYKNQRMSEEEYLRYENALFDARASVAEVEAKKWQDIATLAVIYGNDLEEIVK